MKTRKVMAFLFAFVVQCAFAGESAVSLNIVEQYSNVFAGEESAFRMTVTANDQFKGRVAWGFASGGGILARGEGEVLAQPGKDGTVEARLATPEVKEGVILQASLSVSLFEHGRQDALTNLVRTIWLFSKDSFSYRRQWLEEMKIHLFDPEKKTAETLAESKAPFEMVGNIDALPGINDGILVIGEGVSFKDYRGLWGMMVKAAASGTPVLCLASSGGEVVVPGMGNSDLPQPASMTFQHNDIIRELDKRLDADAWPPDGRTAMSSMKLKGERGPVVGEMCEGGDGWTWIEMQFAGGKKLVMCGFAIIEKWHSGPTPRFLFARLLEYLDKHR